MGRSGETANRLEILLAEEKIVCFSAVHNYGSELRGSKQTGNSTGWGKNCLFQCGT